MPSDKRLEKKRAYVQKFVSYVEEYKKILIVNADHVRSKQMQDVRIALRGKGVMIMGKNSMMRRGLLRHINGRELPIEKVLNEITGNIGFIFTNEPVTEIRDLIAAYHLPAAARQGSIAPISFSVPAGNTGLEPTKTSFFQALDIQTKITRGTVDIIKDHPLIVAGQKVGSSEATLLGMLGIKPFSYGLKILKIYDEGSLIDLSVLDITDDDIAKSFSIGVSNVAALSLGLNYPTLASIPHSMMNGWKQVLAVSLGTDYTFPQSAKIKDMIENPDKFVTEAPKEEAKEESKEEVEEVKEDTESESDDDMGFGMFGEDSD